MIIEFHRGRAVEDNINGVTQSMHVRLCECHLRLHEIGTNRYEFGKTTGVQLTTPFKDRRCEYLVESLSTVRTVLRTDEDVDCFDVIARVQQLLHEH